MTDLMDTDDDELVDDDEDGDGEIVVEDEDFVDSEISGTIDIIKSIVKNGATAIDSGNVDYSKLRVRENIGSTYALSTERSRTALKPYTPVIIQWNSEYYDTIDHGFIVALPNLDFDDYKFVHVPKPWGPGKDEAESQWHSLDFLLTNPYIVRIEIVENVGK